MLHSGRQECFLFLPWIKDSFSEDLDFDLSGQLNRSTQELFNLTSTVTLPLRSTWFGPRRLWFAFRWRRPDSSFVVWYCCPYGSYAAILNSQKTFDAEIATLSLDLRYKAWQGLKVSSSGGCAKICPKRMGAKISMVKKMERWATRDTVASSII